MSPVSVALLLGLAPGLLGGLLRRLLRDEGDEDPWKYQLFLILTRQDFETDEPSPDDASGPDEDWSSPPPIDVT
jgi:hypothetical protein